MGELSTGDLSRSHTFIKLSPKLRRWIERILILIIVIYPLTSMFLGLDLGDTGYHIYAYVNMFNTPDKINYTSILSTMIGHVWYKLFGGFGLIAFNALEVILELSLAYFVFHALKNILGRITTLLGLLVAMLAMNTYLNIFNYHQLNVWFLVVMMLLQYRAIYKKKPILTLWSGVVYAALVFARLGSVVAIVTVVIYFIAAIEHKNQRKLLKKHALFFVIGILIMLVLGAFILYVFNMHTHFINNVFRLQNIASDESSAYNFGNLLSILIFENMKVMVVGIVFLASSVGLLYSINLMTISFRQACLKKSKRVYYFLTGLLTSIFLVYGMYTIGELLPVPTWSQMTNGPAFSIGIMYVFAWGLILFNTFKKDNRSEKIKILSFMSLFLVILTIAGSNTKTKHVVLAMWFIAPIMFYVLKQLFLTDRAKIFFNRLVERTPLKISRKTMVAVLLIFAIMFNIPFINMLRVTANYDTTDFSRLTHRVNNHKVNMILTTKEEATALNEIMEIMDNYNRGVPLMVYGSSLLFYYMTDRPAYVMPWLTAPGYSAEALQEDLIAADEAYVTTRPLIIWCRTDYSFGFTDDAAEIANLQFKERNRRYGKKPFIMFDYLVENNYGVRYFNDYYYLLVPDYTTSEAEMKNFIEVMNIHALPSNIWHYEMTDEGYEETDEDDNY